MKVELVTIGDEIISGSILNTNAPFIASHLYSLGFKVVKISTIGDNVSHIIETLRSAQGRVNAVIITGGLGPTVDDLTAKAAAKAFRTKVVLNKQALKLMQERFQQFGRTMTPHNLRQAHLPRGATPIPNPVGTACGFHLTKGNTLFVFLPGVPQEMERMCQDTVFPLLTRKISKPSMVKTQVLKIFGQSESYCDQLLREVIKKEKDVHFAFLPHYPEITLKLTVRGNDQHHLEEKLTRVTRTVITILGDIVFGTGDETLEEVVGTLLQAKGWTLSVAESCTGGLITHRLTNVPGSSGYLERALVVYSNTSKRKLLKIPSTILKRHGAVSKETAEWMARNVRTLSGTTLGLAVTGIAGPSGGTPEKPVGTVFIALASGQSVRTEHHQCYGDREHIKLMTSQYALDLLRKYLL